MDPSENADSANKNQYGVLKLHTSPTGGSTSEYSTGQYTSLSFANPVYEPQATGPSYKVEDVVMQIDGCRRRPPGRWRGLKSKKKNGWEA